MVIRNWTECLPHVGHENILIHYILSPKGTDGKTEDEAPLQGNWSLTRHSIQPGKQGDFHTHPSGTVEHVFYVTAGRGQIKLDDTLHDIKQGDAIHVPTGVGHQNFNTGDDWLDLLVITAKVE